MDARAAYQLIVTRSGRTPSVLAAADRIDQIEVVDNEDLEVVLFWDVPARATQRIEAELRADLETLDADEFYARWAAFDVADV